MCTVTIIQNKDAFDLYMSRDERHERAPEYSSAHHWGNDILAPLDPESNGTWLAVNTKTKNWGALLNGYTEYTPLEKTISRGGILPTLLQSEDPISALNLMDCTRFMSFKLILNARLFHWDGISVKEEAFQAEQGNVLFQTSSSYKQDDVIKDRKILLYEWIKEGQPHHKDDLPSLHLSRQFNPQTAILMHRDDSCTKSITHLHVGEGTPTMRHFHVSDLSL
jgi:hypothetical protein